MSQPHAGLEFRPALAGVRAVAVLAVVGYHLGLPGLRGGFLGVDMFFVLSGYLITSLLLTEHAATGRIRLSRFYIRRARRLLPAVVLVLAAVLVVGKTYDAVTQLAWRQDSVATLLYIANWHFISADASYFNEFSDPSPLRHMWSLAIEEQFYLVWPPLLLAFLGIRSPKSAKSAKSRSRLRAVAIVAVVGTVASVLAMALLWSADPSRSYYGTDTRVHQLLIGVITAVTMSRMSTRKGGSHRRVKWGGHRGVAWALAGASVGLAVALVRMSGESLTYYRGGSLLVAVLTAALIWGVEVRRQARPESSPIYWLLTGRVMVWIGAISYSLYLWHWPMTVWLYDGFAGLTGARLALLKFALSMVAATISYYLVEQPFRQGAILNRLFANGWSLLSVPVCVALLAVGLVRATPRTATAEWATDVQPGIFRVLGNPDPHAPTLAVVGDSIAKSLVGAMGEEAARRGYRLIAGAWSGCGLAVGFQTTPQGAAYPFSDACRRAVPARYGELVSKFDPDVVWAHSVREIQWQRTTAGRLLAPMSAEHDQMLRRGYLRAYRALTAGGAQLQLAPVTLRAPRHKGSCRQSAQQDSRCAADTGTSGSYNRVNSLINELASRTSGAVSLVGTTPIICPLGPPCPDFPPDGQEIYLRWDGSHFTDKGAHYVAPLLMDAIERASGTRLRARPATPSG